MLIAPEIGDSPQRHQQRGRAHQHNVVFQRFANEFRLAIDRQQEGRLHRDKHQNVVERAQPRQLLVVFTPQQAHMVAYGSDMLLQRRFTGIIIFGIEIAFVGHQGHLGIDNHVFPLRQTDNHIRLHPRAVVRFDAHLGLIFMALPQPGRFQHAGQHHLAPVALGFVIALKRASQV